MEQENERNDKVVISCRAIIARGFFTLNTLTKKYSSVPSGSTTVLIIFEGNGRPFSGDIFGGFPSPEMFKAANEFSDNLKKYRDDIIGHLIAYGKLPLPKNLNGAFWHVDTGTIPHDLHTVHEGQAVHNNYLNNYRLERGALVEDTDDYVAFAIEELIETRIVKVFDDSSFVVAAYRPDDHDVDFLKVTPKGEEKQFSIGIEDEVEDEALAIETAITDSGVAIKSR